MSGARKKNGSEDRHPISTPELPPGYVSRRGILVAAGSLLACSTDVVGTSGAGGNGAGGSGEGGAGAGGTGGSGAGGRGAGGTGAGGTGAGGNGAGGSQSTAGTGGGNAGTGGAGGGEVMADAGASGGTGGGADAATFRDGATIEAGNPQGMVDGATSSCRVTSRDQLGPYYKNGHLERAMMAGGGEGMPLIVTGRVLNTKCQPLAGAKVDVWSANGKGVYSEQGNGWCRGFVKTDNDGNYRYEIVYPGPYQGRPRHLHLIISQPGYTSITTQMYFKNENPDIPLNAVERVMMGGAWHSKWDIVIPGSGMAAAGSRIHHPRTIPRRFWGAWSRPAKTA